MGNKLGGLQPADVFAHFETLTQIPRESGNEKAVSDYLVSFAKEHGLEVIQEDCLNVIIKKPGTAGKEKAPRVILQGHMDMVCTKREDLDFNFNTDPIPVVVDGDFVKTEGTTLGADNGIAVAMAMAILASNDLPHPPITALITVAEETGMDGAMGLEPENIEGDILINIDSEEEGTLLASCAGGVNSLIRLPIQWAEPTNGTSFKLGVRGLKGGHSGMEINKNRANSMQVMGRLLETLKRAYDIELAYINGGEKMNAIAKFTDAVVTCHDDVAEELKATVQAFEAMVKNEYQTADPDLMVELEDIKLPERVFAEETTDGIITILRLMPYGVQTMSNDVPGLVESSNNLGVLSYEGDTLIFSSAIRSSVRSLKDEIGLRMQRIAELAGAEQELVADYPEWEYKVNSPIRDLMATIWKDKYGKDIEVDAIHAGLECGLLKEKVGDIDMVSLGPNLYDVHTPEEKMSIGSVARVYDFLVDVLAAVE